MKNDNLALNVRLMAKLLSVAMAIFVCVFLIHRFQVSRLVEYFLSQAQLGAKGLDETEDPLEKVEKVKAVAEQYNRYLAQKGDDLEVEQELALLYYDAAKSLNDSLAKETDPDKRRNIRRFISLFYNSAVSRIEKVLLKSTDQPELRAKLVDILSESHNWTSAIEHIKFLCKPPKDTAELAKLFDRFDLWKRISPPLPAGQEYPAALERFFSRTDKKVDREELLDFLEADLWMILDDPHFLSIYASCQAAREKYATAEASLKKAISLMPEDPELYEKLATILMVMKLPRNDDADYWMNAMVEANPNSYDAKLRRGRYWNRVARYRESRQRNQLAKNALRDAVGTMQKAITIIADEADRQVPTLPKTKALKDALEKLPEKAPSTKEEISPDYRQALLKANQAALALKGNIEEISEEIDACRDGLLLAAQAEWLDSWLSSDSPKDVTKDGTKDGAKNALEDARLYAENLTSLYPAFSSGYSVLSEIELQAGGREKAIATLRKGSKASDDSAGLLWRLASLLIDGGQIEDAKQVCRELNDKNAAQFIVDHLRARIAYSEGRWLEAAESFEAVRDEVAARWPSRVKNMDFLLAECYGRLGRIDQQRDAYFRAASSDRTWLPALMGIAKTKAKAGQIDEAIEDYRLILKQHNAPKSTVFELAGLLIKKNLRKTKNKRNWQEITGIVTSLEKSNADSLQISLLKANIYFSQGRDAQAARVLEEAQNKLEVDDKFLQTQLVKAKNKAEALSGKEQEEALAQIDQLLAASRKNAVSQAAAWIAIVNVAKRKKDWKTAEKALLAAREKVGYTVPMRLAQGEYLLSQFGAKAAEPLRSLAGNTSRFNRAARIRLWQGLAGLSLRAGDHEQVKLLSRSVLKDEPGNQTMQTIRFEIAVREKDIKTIEKILDEIEKDEKRPGAFWHYGQAMRLHLLAGQGDTKLLNQAQTRVAEALRMRPAWPAARLLAATLHDRQGNKEAAAESYRKVIDLGVQSSAVIRRAVQLLAGLNRFREADEVLRLLGDRQDSLEGQVVFESSIIKARIGKYDDAIAFARKAAEDSKKASDYVWLGQLLSIVGRRAQNQKRPEEAKKELGEAEKTFEKAVALDPASDVAWVALIQFHGQTGQMEKAEAAIEKARAKLPPQKAAIAIAQCYEAIGKKQDAEKVLLENLAKSPKNAAGIERLANYYIRNKQNEKAAGQLKRIIDGNAKADPDQKVRARRSLATILFQEGGEANRKKALELIESNLRRNAASQTDRYAKAVLLANDYSARQRKKAIPVLEKLLDAQRSPSAEIQFTLAKLYLVEEQMPKFKNLMRNILRGESKEPRYLAFYVDTLINHDELKEAGKYLELLKKNQPDSIVTSKLEAKFAFEQTNYESAIAILKNFLESHQSNKQNKMLHMADVATLLAGFAKILKENGAGRIPIAKTFDDDAESIFRKFIDMQPGRELLLARFLARQGRLKKAIKLAEGHADDSSAEDVANTCFVLLQGTSPNAEQLWKIEQILKNALKKHILGQDANILKTAMAILCDFQGRYKETEALYRHILKKNPDDPTAMNNLALFLSLHNRNLDEAAFLVNQAIRDNGYLPGLLDTRAVVYLAQDRPKKALDDLSMAIQKQPTLVRYFHQAQAYLQDRQKNAAVQSLKKAHKMGLKESALIGVEQRNYRKLLRALR